MGRENEDTDDDEFQEDSSDKQDSSVEQESSEKDDHTGTRKMLLMKPKNYTIPVIYFFIFICLTMKGKENAKGKSL